KTEGGAATGAGCRPTSLFHVPGIEDFQHLPAQPVFDGLGFGRVKVTRVYAEHVVVQVEVFQHHLGVEHVLLVNVHVDHLIRILGVFGQVILDRVDIVIDVVLGAIDIAGEAAHTVVYRHDV